MTLVPKDDHSLYQRVRLRDPAGLGRRSSGHADSLKIRLRHCDSAGRASSRPRHRKYQAI